jgi:cytochrome c biogenesis protein CcdA
VSEPTLLVAAFAGLASLLSLCMLPVIPAFLAQLAGTSLDASDLRRRDVILSTARAPFLLVGLFPSHAFSFLRKHRRAASRIHAAFGGVLIGLGVLVFTDKLSLLANFQLLNEVLL